MPHFAFQSLFSSLLWFCAGFILSMIGINPFLSLLFFDLPMALSFLRKGYFHSITPIVSYSASLLIVGLICVFGWRGASIFGKDYFNLFLYGLGVAFIPGIFALFRIHDALTDFIQDNQAYLSAEGKQALISHPISRKSASRKKPGKIADSSPSTGWLCFLRRFRFKLSIGKFQILIQ
jgi:hypothetical protein